MFEYFYNEIFRSVIIGFGSLFNDIEIRHKNDQDQTWSEVKMLWHMVPSEVSCSYEQEADLNNQFR